MSIKSIIKGVTALALTTTVISTSAAANDLIFTTFLSSEHHLMRNVFKPFAAELEEKTGGELKMEVVPGGALAGAKETLTAVSNGTVDGGYIIDIYTPSQLPHTALLADLALQIGNSPAATAAMNETVLLGCPECRSKFDELNVMPLGYTSTSTYSLYCTSPVASLEQFQGKRIRATSAWAPLVQNLGGTPVSIPISEIFEGLQRGALDCSVGPITHLRSYSLFELITDVNEMPIGAYAGSLILNLRKDLWDDLGDDQRAAILDLIPKYVATATYSYNSSVDEVSEMAKEQGINWLAASDDFKDAYDAHNASALEAAIKKGDADPSISDAEGLINTYLSNLAKWTAISESVTDQAAFEQALRDEIYSKLN